MTVESVPVFDGHNDTLTDLFLPDRGHGRSFFEESSHGHVDLPRARRGGLVGGICAIFVPPYSRPAPPPPGEPFDLPMASAVEGWREAFEFVTAVAALLFRLEENSGGAVRVARHADDIDQCRRDGAFAAVLHIEGAEAIDPDFNSLYVLHRAGLRSLGPVWSRPNAFGHGVPFRYPSSPDTGPGLTETGHRLVEHCNGLGIVVDLAHITERGFWDVAERSSAPLVVSHAAANALCPTARNLTDRQIDAVGTSNGLIGINFHVGDLVAGRWGDPSVPITAIVDHAVYVADRIGIDHVGFGSDFDGAMIPRELKDAAGLPRLLEALDDRGLRPAEIEQMAYDNWLRVLRATWKART